MNPQIKKFLSSLGLAVAGAALVAIEHQVKALSPLYTQAVIDSLAIGAAHWLDAWGHSDRVAAAVAADRVASLTNAAPPDAP